MQSKTSSRVRILPSRLAPHASRLPSHAFRLTPSSGLTLAEVLIGMTIMVIALMPLMLMIAGGSLGEGTGGGGSGTLSLLRRTQSLNKAMFIAGELLDEHVRILRNNFGAIASDCDGAPAGGTTCAGCNTTSFAYDEAPFRWATDICTNAAQGGIPDSSGADPGTVKSIKITVWRDSNGDTTLNSFEDSFSLNTKVTSRERNP